MRGRRADGSAGELGDEGGVGLKEELGEGVAELGRGPRLGEGRGAGDGAAFGIGKGDAGKGRRPTKVRMEIQDGEAKDAATGEAGGVAKGPGEGELRRGVVSEGAAGRHRGIGAKDERIGIGAEVFGHPNVQPCGRDGNRFGGGKANGVFRGGRGGTPEEQHGKGGEERTAAEHGRTPYSRGSSKMRREGFSRSSPMRASKAAAVRESAERVSPTSRGSVF